MKNHDFQSLLQAFFLERMMSQQKVSPCTIAAYRDTFRILLKYLHDEQGIPADSMKMEYLNADCIMGFLNHLERARRNKARTVNHRLAAIKAFMDYVSYECPEYLEIVRKVKGIRPRNMDMKEVCYLNRAELDALLAVCDCNFPEGRRDHLMLLILFNAGIRVSEMTALQGKDAVMTGSGRCHLRIMGKGRKERTIPLWKTTTKCLSQYIHENDIRSGDYLLSGRNVQHLTRSGVRYRMNCLVRKASVNCPQLNNKAVSPHVFRHSTAMNMLQSGIDLSTIAIWLGHESVETTHKYMVADLVLKESALNKIQEPDEACTTQRYHAADDMLAFLKSL